MSAIFKLMWGSTLARCVTVASLAFLAWQVDRAYQRHVGRSGAIAQINEQAKTQTKQAVAARKYAERPGAAQRLMKQHCRDC